MWEFLVKGGPVMIPLGLCSIFLVAVLLERRKALEVLRMDLGSFKQRLLELVRGRDFDGAIQLCKETPSPVAEVLGVGLRRCRQLREQGRGDDMIEMATVKVMEDYAPHVVNRLERYLSALFIVGNVAPLMGFLGTVTGMIKCFRGIAKLGGMHQDAIATGISEALITCAAGLIVAIPAFVAYHHFSTRIKDFAVEMDAVSTEVVEAALERPRAAVAEHKTS